MQKKEFTIYPIGVVHSTIAETAKMPKDGISNARIEIFEEYLPALHGLDKFSHIYLMCFFHKSDRNLLRIDPEKVQFRYANCDDAPLGVFSGRSPARPNPVSLTVVKINSVRGNIIEIEHCDAIDQTPVVDIKPYNGGIDRFMNLSTPSNVPKNFDMKLRWVRRIVENVTGADKALVPVIARVFVDAFDRGYIYNSKKVSVRVSNIPELVDSAIFLADATFSSGRLMVLEKNDFEVTFAQDERILKYELLIELEKICDADILKIKKIDEIFRIVEKKNLN